ncbi:MAG: Smr/MutS family protein [Spirochaetales bacterium]|nr:Smr/MutS family protein [Spirochaetales bacterium]
MAARHPLLGPGAVPIDLTLDRQTRTLIITGPNTGGKTVALKTAGLLVMMHQFGLPIPAGPDSALALASGVYGDIGDDQSIENSLSTFSGHVSRYAAIMALADDRSLVLLDELGGGTDPGEGAALAMALLDWFAEKNITVITTTHLGVMKNYGFTRPGARNASVAFDGESLKPAYRIVEGIPGESHALEIARAAGLPEAVIRRAGAYREKDQDQVSRIIEDLLESRRRADRQEEELQETRRTLEETRRRMDLRELKLRQREAEVRREDYGDLKRWVRESRRKLENLVSDLISRGEGGLSRDDTRRVRDFVQEISLKMEQEEGTAAEEPRLPEVSPAIPASPGAPSALEPGGEVRVRSSGALGVLIRRERDGKWQVAIGPLRISLEAADLEPRPPSPAPPAYRFISPEGGAPRAALELDLRGQRLEEALRRLEFQIDSCLLSGLTAFSVIHGLGEGVLRKGVRDYLAACPQVKSFDYAPANEGGFGKTRVTL